MNKIFLSGLALTLCSSVALAQGTDALFPELEGQFEPAPDTQPEPVSPPQAEVIQLEVEQVKTSTKPDSETAKPKADKKLTPSDIRALAKKESEEGASETKGNLVIKIQDVDGVLPYARTLSYCSANAVLYNETNQLLEQLSLTVTYKDMPKDLNYAGVPKDRKRTQNFMLIGLPCESINGMPQFEIKTCKLRKQSEEECKKRVHFVPPTN